MYKLRDPDIEAVVTLLSTKDGGRQNASGSGYRPAHLVKENYLTTAMQYYIGQETLYPGESCLANIWFITPEAYPQSLWVGKNIQFQEGGRVVGYANVTQINNELLLKHS